MENPSKKRSFLSKPVRNDLTANLIFKILTSAGWKFQVPPKVTGSSVWVGYPHTTNWDGFFTIMGSIIWDYPSFTLVKEYYDKPVLRDILKTVNILPIKRSIEGAKLAQEYYKKNKVSIIISPEGTRKKAKGWKKGFHYFAKENGLPIVLCQVDYKNKFLGWDGVVEPGNTPEETLQKCKEIYEKTNPRGLYPELVSPICY